VDSVIVSVNDREQFRVFHQPGLHALTHLVQGHRFLIEKNVALTGHRDIKTLTHGRAATKPLWGG
jgi:hypothetical protein